MTNQNFEFIIRRATKQVWAKRKSRNMSIVQTAYMDIYHVTEDGYNYLMLMHHGVFKAAVLFMDYSDFHCLTLPEYQRQGYIFRLLSKAYLPFRFITTQEVLATAEKKRAIGLLKKLGFQYDKERYTYFLSRDRFRKKFQSTERLNP